MFAKVLSVAVSFSEMLAHAAARRVFFVRCFQISLECCCPCCLVGRVRSNVFVTFKV